MLCVACSEGITHTSRALNLFPKSTLDKCFRERGEGGGRRAGEEKDVNKGGGDRECPKTTERRGSGLAARSVLGVAAWHVPPCVPTIAAAS